MRLVVAIFSLAVVAACGDPMADLPRYSEQDIPEASVALEALPTEDEPQEATGGLLSRLFGSSDREEPAAETELAETTDTPEVETMATAKAEPAAQETSTKRRGLLGLFAGSPQDKPRQQNAAAEVQSAPSEDRPAQQVQVASVDPEAPSEPQGRGLFGLLGGASSTPEGAAEGDIQPGTVLPYGQVARVCGVPASRMGKKIASFPEKRSRYKLFDSQPGNTAPHTFYLTGFDDGCARQFTASLAVFGSVSMHEQLRYGLPAEVQPYSTTDEAYEDLKRGVCKVPRRKPCGNRIGLLERDTVFLSIYERFDSNAHWTNLLLHDGQLVAQDNKSS